MKRCDECSGRVMPIDVRERSSSRCSHGGRSDGLKPELRWLHTGPHGARRIDVRGSSRTEWHTRQRWFEGDLQGRLSPHESTARSGGSDDTHVPADTGAIAVPDA